MKVHKFSITIQHTIMEGNFSDRVSNVIRLSREEALRLGHDYIGTEHLLLGIIREGDGMAVKILRNLGVDLFKLKKSIEDSLRATSGTLTIGNIPLTKNAEMKEMIIEPLQFRRIKEITGGAIKIRILGKVRAGKQDIVKSSYYEALQKELVKNKIALK